MPKSLVLTAVPNEIENDRERQAIIEAAYRCLAVPHTGHISMSVILRAAGVSSRAFYRHFGSKDELYVALLQQECDNVVARVGRVAEQAKGTPANQLAGWIGEMFDVIVEPQRRLQLAVIDLEEVRAAKGYRETRERSHADRERSLAEILRRGLRDGSFPLTDPECDAIAISEVVSRALTNDSADDVERIKRVQAQVVDFALRAVGAVPRG